jgi:hypothetical protein
MVHFLQSNSDFTSKGRRNKLARRNRRAIVIDATLESAAASR